MRQEKMTRSIFTFLLLFFLQLLQKEACSALLINEISTGGQDDWVELYFTGPETETDISTLLVTMYYGSNEQLASSPVTLKSQDDPATPYDDRFAVIHFTSGGEADETDIAGDLNDNLVRDIYCDNYGLWNTDCVVSIDSDDIPENGGITDFVAMSNRDGSMNSTIGGYIDHGVSFGQWTSTSSMNRQDWCCFTGNDGLEEWQTLSRKSVTDTNSMSDFQVTPYSTPGRKNLFKRGSERKIIRVINRNSVSKIGKRGKVSLNLFVYKKCTLRIKVFNSIGLKAGKSKLIENIFPGYCTVDFKRSDMVRRLKSGLFIFHIEAVASGNGGSQKLLHTMSLILR